MIHEPGGKEIIEGRWQALLRRLDVQDALDQLIECFYYFSNPVNKFVLTYHSKLVNEDSANVPRQGRRDCFEFTHTTLHVTS